MHIKNIETCFKWFPGQFLFDMWSYSKIKIFDIFGDKTKSTFLCGPKTGWDIGSIGMLPCDNSPGLLVEAKGLWGRGHEFLDQIVLHQRRKKTFGPDFTINT